MRQSLVRRRRATPARPGLMPHVREATGLRGLRRITANDLADLQASHGNQFVQRLVTLQRRPDWADKAGWADARAQKGDKANVPPGKTGTSAPAPTDKAGQPVAWNAFAQLVDGMWRIPVEGLKTGQSNDLNNPISFGRTAEKKVDPTKSTPASSRTHESPAGKAIAYVSESAANKPPGAIDVMLHFHGFGVGYRQLQSGSDYAEGLEKQQVRDVDLYQMPSQLSALAASRPVVGILPQGSFSAFASLDDVKDPKTKEVIGQEWGVHYSFSFGTVASDPGSYVDQVFKSLQSLGLWSKPPSVGGIILSGHSGGGTPALNSAKSIEAKATDPKNKPAPGAPAPPRVTDLVLLDAINGSTERDNVQKFLEERIKLAAATLKAKSLKDAMNQPEVKFRFRGLYHLTSKDTDTKTVSFYAGLYRGLEKKVNELLAQAGSDLSADARKLLESHYTIKGILVPGGDDTAHEKLTGAKPDSAKKGVLEEALRP